MKNFYYAILEVDIDDGCMPKAADSPLRTAIEQAVAELHPSAKVIRNSSGWGLSEFGAAKLITEACKDENYISKEDVDRR